MGLSFIVICENSVSNTALLSDISQIAIKLKNPQRHPTSEEIEEKYEKHKEIQFAKCVRFSVGLCGGQFIGYPAPYNLGTREFFRCSTTPINNFGLCWRVG